MAKARMTTNTGRGVMSSTRGGFTIIEVVLVLAIAGLIFLMVFIALPALQRSQRDTRRRTDLGRMTDVITQYKANNNGRLPLDGVIAPMSPEDQNRTDGRVLLNGMCSTTANNETGSTSSSPCNLIRYYLNGAGAEFNEYVDPDGPAYGITITTYANQAMPDYNHMIYIYKKAACDGESVVSTSNTRDYAVVYRLEGSGLYCQDNGGGAAGATKTTN